VSQQSNNIFAPLKFPVYTVKWMGGCVKPFFALEGVAAVMGVTSKGIFLQNLTGEVVFISGEVFQGPITINLYEMFDFKALFTVGDKCQIVNGRLNCPGCLVVLSGTPIWEPPTIMFEKGRSSQALGRGIDLVRKLVGHYEDGLFFPFLDRLVRGSGDVHIKNLWNLITGVKDKKRFSNTLYGLIGYGRGLTPAGDDFICGFLLVRYYLDEISPPPQNQKNFSDQIAALAQVKTTALSAALMRCAAQGEADERVLNALRWIAQGDLDMNKVIEELLSYGSSSGLDALTGMLAALLPHGAA